MLVRPGTRWRGLDPRIPLGRRRTSTSSAPPRSSTRRDAHRKAPGAPVHAARYVRRRRRAALREPRLLLRPRAWRSRLVAVAPGPALPRRHPRRTHRSRPRLVPFHHDRDHPLFGELFFQTGRFCATRGVAMTLVFSLLTVQTLLGALDTLWNHEIGRAPARAPRRAPRVRAARRARIPLWIPVPGAGLARVARRVGGAHRRRAAAGSCASPPRISSSKIARAGCPRSSACCTPCSRCCSACCSWRSRRCCSTGCACPPRCIGVNYGGFSGAAHVAGRRHGRLGTARRARGARAFPPGRMVAPSDRKRAAALPAAACWSPAPRASSAATWCARCASAATRCGSGRATRTARWRASGRMCTWSPSSPIFRGDARIDAIVNLAGAPVIGPPWTRARRQLLIDSRVKTTQSVLDWCATRALPPRVLVSASAIGFYGPAGDEWLTEDSPPHRRVPVPAVHRARGGGECRRARRAFAP